MLPIKKIRTPCPLYNNKAAPFGFITLVEQCRLNELATVLSVLTSHNISYTLYHEDSIQSSPCASVCLSLESMGSRRFCATFPKDVHDKWFLA